MSPGQCFVWQWIYNCCAKSTVLRSFHWNLRKSFGIQLHSKGKLVEKLPVALLLVQEIENPISASTVERPNELSEASSLNCMLGVNNVELECVSWMRLENNFDEYHEHFWWNSFGYSKFKCIRHFEGMLHRIY